MEELENLQEVSARWRKVARLLAVLYAYSVDVAAVRSLTPEQWRGLAAAAGIRPPSARTIELLRETVAAVPGRG